MLRWLCAAWPQRCWSCCVASSSARLLITPTLSTTAKKLSTSMWNQCLPVWLAPQCLSLMRTSAPGQRQVTSSSSALSVFHDHCVPRVPLNYCCGAAATGGYNSVKGDYLDVTVRVLGAAEGNTFVLKPDQSAVAIDCRGSVCVEFWRAKYGTLHYGDLYMLTIWP